MKNEGYEMEQSEMRGVRMSEGEDECGGKSN